jgi:hypothetical protein
VRSAWRRLRHTFTFEATAVGATTLQRIKAGMDISDEGVKEETNAAVPWKHLRVLDLDKPTPTIQ